MLFPGAKTSLDLNDNFNLTINNFVKKSENINDFHNNIKLSINHSIIKNNNNLKYNDAESMKVMYQSEIPKNQSSEINEENIIFYKKDILSKLTQKSDNNNYFCSQKINGNIFNLFENIHLIKSSNPVSILAEYKKSQNKFSKQEEDSHKNLINDQKTLKDIMDIQNLFRYPCLPTFEEFLESMSEKLNENCEDCEVKISTSNYKDKHEASKNALNYSG